MQQGAVLRLPLHERKHLVFAEVEKLLDVAKGGRHAARDRCLLLLMFRHGLRVSEACGLVLSQVDSASRILHVHRLKDGLSTTHPLRGDELRAIKAWLADRARMKPDTDAFFVSERRRPLSRKTVWAMIRDYGREAGPARRRPSPHAAPRLWLRPGRPGRGHAAHPGLSGASEYSAYGDVHSGQPGKV